MGGLLAGLGEVGGTKGEPVAAMAERNNYFPTNPNSPVADNSTSIGGTNFSSKPDAEESSSNPLHSQPNSDNLTPRPATDEPSSNPAQNRNRTEPLHPSLRRNGNTENSPTSQEVLRGSLLAFSPSSLLSLLNIQKSTGTIRLRNARSEGYIYVQKGEVFDAGLGSVNGALALFQLFGWRQGSFWFEVDGPTPPRRTIEASLPVLQVRATLWLDNMNKYLPIIPSTSHRIAIAKEPRSEVVIEPYQWPVLTKIVSHPMSIAYLAAELEQDLMTVTRIAADLVKMGVAVVYEPDPADASPSRPSL